MVTRAQDTEAIRAARELREWAATMDDAADRDRIPHSTEARMLREAAELLDRLVARLEAAERKANEHRIESDCGLRDYDALELQAGDMRRALETIAAGRRNRSFDPWARDVARAALAAAAPGETEQTP